VDWSTTYAAVWRAHSRRLRPVRELDAITFDDLLGIDVQAAKLKQNTERFISGQPCNHVLLWGSRGTGKSSLVKAMLNAYAGHGLRVVEVDRDDLLQLPEIVDDLREQPFYFVVYCDDLSFEQSDRGYRHLKSVLEGSIEPAPKNVRLMATSNRRHLLPEYHHDNADGKVIDGELHLGDALEEKISLADRFGLCLSFHPVSQDKYFAMIDQLFPRIADRDRLHTLARRFSTEKGSRSGRTAQQFYRQYIGELEC
jgi:uncharacterized protein